MSLLEVMLLKSKLDMINSDDDLGEAVVCALRIYEKILKLSNVEQFTQLCVKMAPCGDASFRGSSTLRSPRIKS